MDALKILIAGDFCPLGRNEPYIQEERFSDLFNGFEKITASADYSLVNLECPITEAETKINKTGPNLKSSLTSTFKALRFAGFDALTLANNHIQDYGGKGVMDTIEGAKKNQFDFLGAGKNRIEASKALIKNLNGIKIGFINIAENEFCAATQDIPGAYTFNWVENLRLIQNTKPLVDKLVLIYHGGREHYQLPTPNQRERFRYFIEAGVDAIVAHHTHCVSGYEYHQGKPILYSLGNFVFDYKKKYQKGLWTRGMSVLLHLEGKDKDFRFELIPHTQGTEMDSTLNLLTGKEKEDFLKEVENLHKTITDDRKFDQSWQAYLKTQEAFYLSSLYIKNLYVRALFMKGILPVSLLRKKHRLLLLNLNRCEAHHEITQDILNL